MPPSAMIPQYPEICSQAAALIPSMREWAVKAPYERKGILYSEILFMLACLHGTAFSRVLESGRARGQSTLLLSLALPQKEIVSIEFDAASPDVAVAGARLQGLSNVKLLFGDARKLLPAIAQQGDVALIDGPKGFRSVRLAIRLLMLGRVSHVFVHDLSIGTAERTFIAKNFPEARFSDCRGYAEVAAGVDAGIQSELQPSQRLGGFTGDFGYGFSLTCLPRMAGRSYRLLLLKALAADFRHRITKKKTSGDSG